MCTYICILDHNYNVLMISRGYKVYAQVFSYKQQSSTLLLKATVWRTTYVWRDRILHTHTQQAIKYSLDQSWSVLQYTTHRMQAPLLDLPTSYISIPVHHLTCKHTHLHVYTHHSTHYIRTCTHANAPHAQHTMCATHTHTTHTHTHPPWQGSPVWAQPQRSWKAASNETVLESARNAAF